ncbi:glycosyltransferase family 4 protein [Actinomyces sp. B33]|uniref:glycosyltransferase family 4 protein n=1 Tax=Actinomyces sp. B33 TaxID=2942131 RepID=UPI002340401F|nr:glycosyltransferase family 4 protein [Actinomyces sp. B33]MDC4232645.1 glycosyltransferase family 4 protein [Actinomyces sp. B33]
MRIAMIVNSYPPRMGGLESHIQNLAEGLVAQGHRVWVLTISADPGRRVDGGVEVLTGRSHLPIADVISFPAPGARRSISRFLRAHAIDLVSVHTRFFPMSLIGVRAARACAIPVVHTEHGSGFVASPSPLISWCSRLVDVTAGRYVLRHADRVLGVSAQAADFAGRLGGVPARVFHNAITPPLVRGEVVDRPGRLVFVGRIVEGKGWDDFLHAVAALRARGHEVDGEVLGAGPCLEDARALRASLGLDGAVDLRGRVSADEVRRSLAGATLVNPTVLSEGFQTTLLEALAEQGRVVTYVVPGAELLRDAGAPIVICPEKTRESLVESLEGMLAVPGEPAPAELIDEWTWPVRSREYARIAEEVVAERRSAR